MTESPTPDAPERRGGLRSDQVSGLFLLLLALFIAWENRSYPLGSLHEPGPGYLPLALAIFLGVTGLLIAVTGGKSTAYAAVRWPELTRSGVILLSCAFAAFALERIGYRLTMAALLIFFLGVVERKKPFVVAAVAIGFSVISYLVFATWLRVPLPIGPGGI
ncbi:MAG TPA: tripartite tricarboxylate transporter TctB family protein [Burkholderiales bacterium]|nr:tripartite tricarboxylate transporter TctB family protein [Burkholderiales bacterium]